MSLSESKEQEQQEKRLERLALGVEELLQICAINEVDVPERLKESLRESLETTRLDSHVEVLQQHREKRKSEQEDNNVAREFRETMKKLKAKTFPINVRVKNGSYKVTNYYTEDIQPFSRHGGDGDDDGEEDSQHLAKQKIKTVKTENPCYKLMQCLLRCIVNKGDVRSHKEEKYLMQSVDLALESGKMYLVLGAPGSGKSTLLKMIAQDLYISRDHKQEGDISICGIKPSKDTVWTNLTGYIDQIDRLHSFLTVLETCEFAWHCRSGGTHRKPFYGEGPEVDEQIDKMDEEMYAVHRILQGLGLARVKDTFVGDQSRVRGVSGGEKKRVTVAEMLTIAVPVLCCDEISTGLDAATTFDITRLLGAVNKITNTVKIVSLLQPPPETVANFDDLILLSEGKIIYCGPVEDVISHFNSLGYEIPERMDVADWLQALPTKDGWLYLRGAKDENASKEDLAATHLTTDGFHEKFYESQLGQEIRNRLDAPEDEPDELLVSVAKERFKNSWLESLNLLTQREIILWWRDKYQIKAKIAQDLIMGTVVGTLFFQSSDNPGNVVAVLFQSMFFVIVGSMTTVIKQFPDRSIYYKHQDANFFPTWTFVAGRSVAAIPNAIADAIGYGTMIFFLVGLAHDDGASIANYFKFILMLFAMSLTSGLFFAMYSSSVQTVTVAQACMAITAILFVLFSGFTVQPDVIPDYWIWAYYANYCAWALRGLVVNEFDSGKWDNPVSGTEFTEGESILIRFGFTDNDDDPYTQEWLWWGFLFAIGTATAAVIASTCCLRSVRFATGQSLVTDQGDAVVEELKEEDMIDIPFKRVRLTFKDIHYTVQSSITKEKLELLKGVDGVVPAGKMTALMGSSGAGKTTLMDCLALRKTSGEITGEVCLNGHPQEDISFRRCTGYVEQFDTQTPQLTVRETVEFSAKLRLDESNPTVTPGNIAKFVNQTLNMLELTNIQNLQVGSDAEGGLSFEQKKRLSIAVELAANPSILFLDEPTSGLDARAASIVMRGLKRIALTGRAVCATIHQPSVAIFNEFDSLLLLKRGGEVVFFGELGDESKLLIEYLERYDATPRIQPGENPATWMLTCIGAGSAANEKPFDYAGSYSMSKLRQQCLDEIDAICAERSPEYQVVYKDKFATSYATQAAAVLKRTITVYFRSPAYNVTRVLVSGIIALLFGSVYASQRVPENESDMNSRLNSIYIAVLFLCVNAQNTVLGVFEVERNMFYRHRAANMYGSHAIARAFTLAEMPFVLLTSAVFTCLFYFIMGFSTEPDKFFLFYAFTALGLGTFTSLGQMLVSLLRDSETAQGVGGLLVSFSAMFAGILMRPSDIPPFWIFMYWVMPSHYLFEGLFMSQFNGDDTKIKASPGSPFFESLVKAGTCQSMEPDNCYGTAEGWFDAGFPDWSVDSIPWNILYFAILIVTSRIITYTALTNLDYRAN